MRSTWGGESREAAPGHAESRAVGGTGGNGTGGNGTGGNGTGGNGTGGNGTVAASVVGASAAAATAEGAAAVAGGTVAGTVAGGGIAGVSAVGSGRAGLGGRSAGRGEARARLRRRRRLVAGGWVAGAGIGFTVYLRLASTRAVNSDGAAQALQAWDMLHGNLLLRGWTTSDVSFYTTELPQYLLIEAARGLGLDVVRVAAAMTYSLVVAAAALLAAGRARGLYAVTRGAIAAGIMLAPQLGSGTNVLLSSPDHIGTSVPLLLTWLALDRGRPGWRVPLITSVLLAWAAVADSIVLMAGIIPLALVCALRVAARLRGRQPCAGRPGSGGPGAGWYEAALGSGAVVAAGAADLTLRAIHAAGGFSVRPLGVQVASAGEIFRHNLPLAGQCLLLLPGADFLGLGGGVSTLFVLLHLAGAWCAAAGIVLAARRLGRLELVSQVLLAAIAVDLVGFAVTNRVYAVSSAREIAPVLPFAAALAGRLLGDPLLRASRAGLRSGAGRHHAGGRKGWAARRGVPLACCVLGAGYLAGLGLELAVPAAPAQDARLTAWLERHQLGTGLSGYWEASVVTLASGGRVAVRPVSVADGRVVPALGEVRSDWFAAGVNAAHYVVLFPGIPGYPGFADQGAVTATFGRPARVYHVGRYEVWYWRANLLNSISH